MSSTEPLRQPGSFRDPSGSVFYRDGVLYRQINLGYREHFQKLLGSGLFDELVKSDLLVAHVDVDEPPLAEEQAYKIIRPELVEFVSYPYEWSFSQLKDAALTTLKVQSVALKFGMTLKDASAFNIQFRRGRPILVDTLSFEPYREGEPWVAYRQFCQHFLAPLALVATRDARLTRLLRSFLDGIPLDLASRLLPWQSKLSLGLRIHIHLHASLQRRYADASVREFRSGRKMSKTSYLGLIDSLESTVRRLKWRRSNTPWADYERQHSYSASGLEHKTRIIERFLNNAAPRSAWDLGANTGRFSRLASNRGVATIAFDADPGAVEQCYLSTKSSGEQSLLPLVMDLTNPSPGLGWRSEERDSLLSRGPADCLMALALIHHLAIGNNVPWSEIVRFLSLLGESLIIEFVPKSDPMTQRLLANREDIFPDYTWDGFLEAFNESFQLVEEEQVADSNRILCLFLNRASL